MTSPVPSTLMTPYHNQAMQSHLYKDVRNTTASVLSNHQEQRVSRIVLCSTLSRNASEAEAHEFMSRCKEEPSAADLKGRVCRLSNSKTFITGPGEKLYTETSETLSPSEIVLRETKTELQLELSELEYTLSETESAHQKQIFSRLFDAIPDYAQDEGSSYLHTFDIYFYSSSFNRSLRRNEESCLDLHHWVIYDQDHCNYRS